MGGCGGLERNDLLTVDTLGGCGGLEITDILTVSTVGRVWRS